MDVLERTAAWNALDEALQMSVAGDGRIVLVAGEAGIGKTTLLEQFSRAQTQRILWGMCDALFTPRPLGPLHDIAPQTHGQLHTLLQEEPNRPVIFAACLDECQSPSILVFEDIHWADEATLDLLKYLGRRMQYTCSLLIATYRDDELGAQHPLRSLLGDLVRQSSVSRLELAPLSLTAVRQLAKNYAGDVEVLHQQTGGNPFFINQVLASDEEGIPATVREVVLARASRLSLSGRAVLNAAAVIGQRIDPWLLAEVVQAEATAIQENLELGILQTYNKHFVFRHDLVRQAIYDETLPHQRIFLHQVVLDILKTSPVGQKDAARLAHHAEAAGDKEAILQYVPLAGEAARQTGMPRAEASLWALMIQNSQELPLLKQAELYENYGLSCRALPDKSVPIEAYRKALELAELAKAPPLIIGRVLVRLATMLVTNAQVDEAVKLIDEALTILELLPPSIPLALAYKNRAYQLLIQGAFEESVAFAEKGYLLAQQLEDIYTIMSTLDTLGLCWLPTDHARGREYMEQTLALTLKHGGFWRAGSVYPNLSMTYVDVYYLNRAEKLIEEGLRFTSEHDNDLAHSILRAWQGMLRLYQGKWEEAQNIVSELIADPELALIPQPATFAAQGRLLARQGLEGAQGALDKALKVSKKMNNLQRMGVVYTARAEAAWLANDPEQTRAEVNAFYEIALKNRQPGFAAELAYWRWLAGEFIETFDWMVEPFVLEIKGDWQAAAAAWEALGCPYEQARALAAGDVEAQKAALLIFERLGAKPMIERVRQKLRGAGVEAIPRGPRAATQENPFNLTNRQLEILSLLTEDLTNAEIAARLHISPKTVGHHVSAVLGKLQVSSRTEAAEIGRQHLDYP
ncbi:ATP-binding protein [Candidatus Leptofilum sp.]|uniref:ATP-binding protein n=1 Tax=Candidatus Leptofilum sp. TaxID=3241576 RepID=UPI003B5A81F0